MAQHIAQPNGRPEPQSVGNNLDSNFHILHEPADTSAATVDIISINFFGNYSLDWNLEEGEGVEYKGWKSINSKSSLTEQKNLSQDKKTVCLWPDLFLSSVPEAFPSARVLTYGYNSKISVSNQNDVFLFASSFLSKLEKARQAPGISTRPLIIIGDIMAGIFMLRALTSYLGAGNFARSPLHYTKGILLFGFSTDEIFLLNRPLDAQFSNVSRQEENNLLWPPTTWGSNLTDDTEFLKLVSQQFNGIRVTIFFNETTEFGSCIDPTPRMRNLNLLPIRLNSSNIISADDASYRKVIGEIRRMLYPSKSQLTMASEESMAWTEKIRKWLKPDNLLAESNSVQIPRGSFEWLFRNPSYKAWLSSQHNPILWITGKPGSGKSTLVKYILTSVQNEIEPTMEQPMIAYFFFSVRKQTTMDSLLRALLYRILEQLHPNRSELASILKTPDSYLEDELKQGYQWKPDILRDRLTRSVILATEIAPVYLFIDGLDECSDDSELVIAYLRHLGNSPSLPCRIRILISSRDNPLDGNFQFPAICVDKENRSDIERFVYTQLSQVLELSSLPQGPKGQRSTWDTQQLAALISERAMGMFLWAKLALKALALHPSQRDPTLHITPITAIIENSSTDLDQLYREVFRRIHTQDEFKVDLVRRTLAWLCCSTRPLTLTELQAALEADGSLSAYISLGGMHSDSRSAEHMARALEIGCGGLIEVGSVDSGSGGVCHQSAISFVHYTVKEFLLDRSFSLLEPESTSSRGAEGLIHSSLGSACVGYISQMGSTEPSTLQNMRLELLKDRYPLLDYAAVSWPTHAKSGEERGVSQKWLLNSFQWPSRQPISTWLYLYRSLRHRRLDVPYRETTLLHVGCRYGFSSAVRHMIAGAQPQSSVDLKDESGWTALHLAAQEGHIEVVKLLLDQGADINMEDNKHGYTPLAWAATRSHHDVVDALLHHRLSVEHTASSVGTALVLAAAAGDQISVKALLNWPNLPHSHMEHYKTQALIVAASCGYTDILRQLLFYGVDPNTKDDRFGQSALCLASAYGKESAVRLLLAADADPNISDHSGGTPLYYALGFGKTEIAKILLGSCATLALIDYFGSSAGSWVSRVVSFLLQQESTGEFRSCNGSSETAGNEGTVNQKQDVGDSSRSKQGKRKRDEREGSSQGDGDGSNGNKRLHCDFPSDKPKGNAGKFPCPFLARYPTKYKEQCSKTGYSTISRLKEHLYRAHRGNFCNWCWESFSDQAETENHQKTVQHGVKNERRDYSEGIDGDQERQLRSRNGSYRNKSEDEKWRSIYRILFPDVDKDNIPTCTSAKQSIAHELAKMWNSNLAKQEKIYAEDQIQDPRLRNIIFTIAQGGHARWPELVRTFWEDAQRRRTEGIQEQQGQDITGTTSIRSPDNTQVGGDCPDMATFPEELEASRNLPQNSISDSIANPPPPLDRSYLPRGEIFLVPHLAASMPEGYPRPPHSDSAIGSGSQFEYTSTQSQQLADPTRPPQGQIPAQVNSHPFQPYGRLQGAGGQVPPNFEASLADTRWNPTQENPGWSGFPFDDQNRYTNFYD